MYADWASLQDEIKLDKANSSVLQRFPSAVGRDVACSVVKHIGANLSINKGETSNLETDTEVKWTMEVLCFGLSLPLSEHETIKDCVNVYCEWLTALTSPKLPVPKPVTEDPNPYAQDMLHHLLNLFKPRHGSVADLVKRQAVLCHRVLRTIEAVAKESAILSRETWETLLKFLLAANDSLLSPPTEKDDIGLNSYDIGDHLCERVLSVLFELWLLACQKCFPSPSLWKTFRKMCIYWRHHEALITQWHRVNHALTSRLLKFMYGPNYPELTIKEDEGGMLVPADMSNDCISQSWFRFLHIIQNPVDLAKPELISQTPVFLQQALESETVIDPRQHECLEKLPQIFYKAMRGVSIMVNAFLGISQDVKEENLLTSMSFQPSRQSVFGPPTPPGQRKSGRPLAAFTQRGSKPLSLVKSVAPTPQCLPGLLSLEGRLPLAPSRPSCNSILHLFGAWLFDAALANVRIHQVHKNAGNAHRRSNSLIDHSRPTSLSIDTSPEKVSEIDNTYEAGRAEACGTLCRIFTAHKTGEEILPAYYSRFYYAMYYGLQTEEGSISGQVLSSILFNACDLLRVDLAGVQILVPNILNALELVLHDLTPKFRLCEQIPVVELRKACIHLLLSMQCLPLHFKELEIKDILSSPNSPEHNISFISLKLRIIELLLRALFIETDSHNTQMLLGGLSLMILDMGKTEEADNNTGPPRQVESEHNVHSEVSQTSVVSVGSTDSSYQESPYQRLPAHSQDNETAYGLFGHLTSLVCNRLMASWKAELSTALAAMELLSGLAKVRINPPNMLMCKRTVKWICDFIVYQCSRPAPHHSRDLHSMIVAAFKCLTLWLVEHSKLLYDKECLHNVLEVVELGISGSKSQRRHSESSVSPTVKLDSKSVFGQVYFVNVHDHDTWNKASDEPKFKGEKDFVPASMRVKDAAEAVLTCIIDQVGAFPPPCGPESLFSLLDERSLLKYAKGTSLPEHGSPFRYFVLDNSIIIGLLEQPLGNYEDPLPTVTALIRGPFGRHAWTMQLRHSPRSLNKMSSSKSLLLDPGRPLPMEDVGTHHVVKHKYFPDSVDKIPLTQADRSIPSLESMTKDSELDKLRKDMEQQTQFENNIARRSQVEAARRPFPNPSTQCTPPKLCQEFQTARLFLSHYGFLSLEALKEPSNSSLPSALVMLDTSNASVYADLELLDTIPSRDSDTVHVFYVKPGQKTPQEIVANVSSQTNVQPQFLEFLHSLGWPVDIGKHAGWSGHTATSWRIMDQDDLSDDELPQGSGGSVYDGRQQVLYWADVMSEVAFVVPSTDTYYRYLADPNGEKSPQFMKRSSSVTLTKPRSLTQESVDKMRQDRDSLGSPTDAPTLRNKRSRQPAHMMGPDTKIFVVWLESFEDHENFPSGDLLGATSTGLEHMTTNSSVALPRSPEKDIFHIYIHALQNGLFRIHLQGHTGKLTMAIPLVDGMVVSRRCLGTLVRQTAINICKRKRLESELYQPPHVRRKLKIQEIVKNYNVTLNVPDFYSALFQDVVKE